MESSHIFAYPEPYLFPKDCDTGSYKAGDSYECQHIYYGNDLVTKNKNASVLIIGNSYIQSPMSSPDSLPAVLSCKLKTSVDWYRVSGYGPFSDIIIRLLTNPETYLKGKKVLIMQVGTSFVTSVGKNETMLDIAQMDNERVLLNGKKMKTHFVLTSNVNKNWSTDEELWGPLSGVDKTVLRIDKKGEIKYTFDLGQTGSINNAKPIICFIPHMCKRSYS